MSKQDRQGVRTASDLEQKYYLGKTFAKVMGIAEDAQEAAEKAEESIGKLDQTLDSEGVFNRLTNNGTLQGIFRGENGELYINADYIRAVEKLFAKDLVMSGKFTNTVEVFLEPGQEEIDTMQRHILEIELIPIEKRHLYDFSGDGQITSRDLFIAQKAMLGQISLADWEYAETTTVEMTIDMSNPDKAVRFTGANMWGREIDTYIGVNFTNIKNAEVADYIVESGTSGIWTFEKKKSGYVELWCQTIVTAAETIISLPENMLKTVNCCMLSLNIEDGVSFIPDVQIGAYANTTTVTVRSSRATQGNGFTVSLIIKGTWK